MVVTTRPFETLRVEETANDLTLRIGRIGLSKSVIGIFLVSIALGVVVFVVFPLLPWRNSRVLSGITSFAWIVSGFMLITLFTIFAINVSRARPGHVLFRLSRLPGGVRCTYDAVESRLVEPVITIGPDRALIADMHRQGFAVNPSRCEVICLSDATTRVAIYSSGTHDAKQCLFIPIERWLRSFR